MTLSISRIRHFKRQDPFLCQVCFRPWSKRRKLEAFLEFLRTIDRWHKAEPLESVIGEKDKVIDQLKGAGRRTGVIATQTSQGI
jgi:hypothetical protein